MTVRTALCRKSDVRYTTRDGLIGAGVMIGVTAAFSALGLALKYSGRTAASQVVLNVAFLGSMMVSMPFWLMKGQPWKAQGVLMGVMVMLLTAVTYVASR